MDEVRIIINGVRYDVVDAKTEFTCDECDLRHLCEKTQYMSLCLILDIEENRHFKKSDKIFEQ